MSNDEIPLSDRDTFLDNVYEAVLERLESGKPPAIDELIRHHPERRQAAVALLRAAEELLGRTSNRLPEIPGFVIERRLGAGGMGIVYLARQENLGGRLVAVKVLSGPRILSEPSRHRFLAEARALARVRHPHVVAVHDVISREDFCSYSMEWIEGCSLGALLRAADAGQTEPSMAAVRTILGSPASAILPDSWVAFVTRIGACVAQALAAVHAAGLIHRDVKSTNILIRNDGTPLLADFGLAVDPDVPGITDTGGFVGTAAFAAPEQLRGERRRIDAQTDVYGLGATLFHAYTGRLPFHGSTSAVVLREIESGPIPGLRRTRPDLSRDLDTIVTKAMDPDPARRYQTATALAEDLDRALALRPILARPPGLRGRAMRWVRRHRGSALAAVLASIGVLALGLVLWKKDLDSREKPAKIQALVHRARTALLDAEHLARLYVTARGIEDGTTLTHIPMAALQSALAEFDEAFAIDPDPGLAIRLEWSVVKAAKAAIDGVAPEREVLETLENEAPLTGVAARAGISRKTSPSEDELSHARESDLRSLGLFSFLIGDVATSNAAWLRLSPIEDEDPFLEGSVGQLLLLLDEPAGAYRRLERACRAFPEAGFLKVAQAEAAIRIGGRELAVAGRLLAEAESLGLRDSFDTLVRVRAEYLAATGERHQAEDLFAWMLVHHAAQIARERLAFWLERWGEPEPALRLMVDLIRLRPTVGLYRRRFIDIFDRWWLTLGEPTRADALASALGRAPADDLRAPLPSLYARFLAGSGDQQPADFLNQPSKPPSPDHQGIVLSCLPRTLEMLAMKSAMLERLPPSWKTVLANLAVRMDRGVPGHGIPTGRYVAGGAIAAWVALTLLATPPLAGQTVPYPPPLPAGYPGSPALVNVVPLSADTQDDVSPAIAFSNAAASGFIVWQKRFPNTSGCAQGPIFGSTWNGAAWSASAPLPGQVPLPWQPNYPTLGFRPGTSECLMIHGAVAAGNPCYHDDIGWRRYAGGAWGALANAPLADGINDDDLAGSCRFAASGSQAVAVWRDDFLSGITTGSQMVAKVWDSSTNSWGTTTTVQALGSGCTPDVYSAQNRGLAEDPATGTWALTFEKWDELVGCGATAFEVGYRLFSVSGTTVLPGTGATLSANSVEDLAPVVAFNAGGQGLIAWTQETSPSARSVRIASWNPATQTFIPSPLPLTNPAQHHSIEAVVGGNGGFHLLILRKFPGESDREICYGWFDGIRMSHLVRLTEDSLDQYSVDAAFDAAGTLHLAWVSIPVGGTSGDIATGRLAFPTIGTQVDNGPFDLTNKTFSAASGATLTWGAGPIVPAALAVQPVSVFVNLASPGPVGSAMTVLMPPVVPSPLLFPNLVARHPLSTPSVTPLENFFAGDGLLLSQAGLGVDLGFPTVSMGSPASAITIGPGLLPPGLEVRLQGLMLWPAIPSMPVLATNETRFTSL